MNTAGVDPAFWRAFRDGDARALALVYRVYAPRVARRLRAHPLWRRQGREEVGDLVQETFCRAYALSARRHYDCARPYQPYLLRIGLNLLVDRLRSQRLEVEAHRNFAVTSIGGDSTLQPSRDPLLIARMSEYVAQLSPACRRVFQARYNDGQSQREAARALGISHQTIRTLEKQIKNDLKTHLGSHKPVSRS
jgi:RNA polymerase sigma factor (sigma-70 family)